MSDQAYEQGYIAFKEGSDLTDNPFQEGSDEYDSWETGWVTASSEVDE